MAVVVAFDPPLDVPWDSLLMDGVPELQMAARNPRNAQLHRGLHAKVDTWTLVSTTAWSYKTRPTHTGNWDKKRVGNAMVRAFGSILKKDVSRHRMVVPTFHWQGASGITKISEDHNPCIFDAEAALGWCGDIFGGLGPAGAVDSAMCLGIEFDEWAAGKPAGSLPGDGGWVSRAVRNDDDDIMSIEGPSTARREPNDGFDHTWPAAAELAAGGKIEPSVDSLARYRNRGILAQDRKRDMRFSDPSWSADGYVAPASKSPKFTLRCEVIDEGLYKVSQLPKAMQNELLAAVFPLGAHGVCGGLYDQKTGRIEVGDIDWQINGCPEVNWSEMGLHGNHVIDSTQVQGELLDEIIAAVRDACKGSNVRAFDEFKLDTVRVAFETMQGRKIKRGQTLCGWSKDPDHVERAKLDSKALLMLGRSTVTIGFKYSKVDAESLDVELSPGDILLLSGPARTWVSACTGVKTTADDLMPFDFVNVWLCDHRQLKSSRPETYKKMHAVIAPQMGDFSYKWMQYEYKVVGSTSTGGRRVALIGDQKTLDKVRVGENVASGRRWKSRASNHQEDECMGA